MDSDNFSFLHGIIAGAGAALALMSVAFMRMVAPLEGVLGFTSTDIRVGIFLGVLVSVAAVAYEIYRTKERKKQKSDQTKDQEIEKKQIKDSESENKIEDPSVKTDE